jgi:aspartate 1-decarboxylase
MKLTIMKSKLHRATVTEADLNYEGSISIDPALCEAARFYPNEKVDIYNINTGARFSTYVLYGKKGQIGLNGAAARMVQPGDKVIIVTFGEVDESEALKYKPTVVLLDEGNQIKRVTDFTGQSSD